MTTTDGREQAGRVDSASEKGLVLVVDAQPLTIRTEEIGRIEARDSLGNGVRNGGIAGAAALSGFGLYLSAALCESPDGCFSNDLVPLARAAALGGAIGAAVGALIDYGIKGRKVLYRRQDVRIEAAPRLTFGSIGAQVTVSWDP